jgi:Zn-dependent protease
MYVCAVKGYKLKGLYLTGSYLLFFCSLLSKPQAFTLPLVLVASYLCVVVHEIGHVLVACLFKIKIEEVELRYVTAFGVQPVYETPWDPLNRYSAYMLLGSAGIFMNLGLALIGISIGQYGFATFNLLLGVLQLLPWPGSDGYQMLTWSLAKIFAKVVIGTSIPKAPLYAKIFLASPEKALAIHRRYNSPLSKTIAAKNDRRFLRDTWIRASDRAIAGRMINWKLRHDLSDQGMRLWEMVMTYIRLGQKKSMRKGGRGN